METITPNSPEAASADLIAENIAELKRLFPDLLSEDREGLAVNVDVLKQLVGDRTITDAEEKYGLSWHGKRAARKLALTPSTGTLRPAADESVNWDTTQNVMIEGDNLEVLKLLQRSYAGKVKLIYIDPPYNTGKDFVYTDNFQDNLKNYLALTGQSDDEGTRVSSNTESSGRFHTNWLNMMFPRLKTAHGLLQRDGVILISIGDQEIANLRLLCDEVFGPENFVATFVWEKGRKNDAKLVSVGHEYLLVYAKSLAHLKDLKIKWREEKPGAREIWEKYLELRHLHGSSDSAIEDDLQAWYASLPKSHPSKKWSRYKHVDRYGPWRDRDISWPGGGGPRYDVPHPKTGLPCAVPERGWIYADYEEMKRQYNLGLVEFRDDHTEPPIRKAHIRPIPEEDDQELDEEIGTEEELEDEEDLANQVRGSYFYKQSQVSVKKLRALMGAKVFNNPKDHEEIARLIHYTTGGDQDAVVMDFFAGSGTTGHSVWELNARDNGRRRFVMVQLPEALDPSKKDQKRPAKYCDELGRPRTIAELTKERLRRAGDALQEEHPGWQGDTGFRVFKLDSSNLRRWDPDRDNLEQALLDHLEHVKPDRSETDVLFELLLKLGLDLSLPTETRSIAGTEVHAVGGGTLITCLSPSLDADVAEAVALGIVDWHTELRPDGDTTCVFRDAAFEDDVAKTNLVAILEQHGITNIKSV